jgi:hypothetical protein
MDDKSDETAPRARPLLHGALTGEIIGAFFEVYNGLRFGFLESAYCGALEIELMDRTSGSSSTTFAPRR